MQTHTHACAWCSMLWHVVQATRHQLERWVPSGTWADFTTAVVGFGQLVQATAMCICCMCTACALRVHCVCTACALRVHCMCTTIRSRVYSCSVARRGEPNSPSASSAPLEWTRRRCVHGIRIPLALHVKPYANASDFTCAAGLAGRDRRCDDHQADDNVTDQISV
jgi:hypothetical protein